MTRKVVYEKAVKDKDKKLTGSETRWDDGSRQVEKYATTSSGYEGYGENSEISLFVNEDPGEDIHEYGVSWQGLCGYFSVSLHVATEEDAEALFEALQKVTGYDPT